MNRTPKTTLLIISLLFWIQLPAQEAVFKNNKKEKNYSQLVHSFAIEFNSAWYAKAQMTSHPYTDRGFDSKISWGSELLLKYNLTFKSGFGITIEGVKGECDYKFKGRGDDSKTFGFERSIKWYMWDLLNNNDRLGGNLKLSYRHEITPWLSILPEIGIQLLYYVSFEGEEIYTKYIYNSEGEIVDEETDQYLYYTNSILTRSLFPDLSMAFNFLFHKKEDPRHNFTVGINANLSFGVRYFGGYSLQKPFNAISDCFLMLTSNYLGVRFGYSYSNFPKPHFKKKEYRLNEPDIYFDLKKPVHSVGFFMSIGGSIPHRIENKQGVIEPLNRSNIVPEFTLRYSCSIKDGWGITAEIPIGTYIRELSHSLSSTPNFPRDTLWSNGVRGTGYGDYIGIKTTYAGITLKASYLTQVHKNISLQAELGVKWMPFILPAKYWIFGESVGDMCISDGTETEKLIYMKAIPTLSGKSYAVPDLAFAFNVLVRGKNPNNNFIFGINANIGFINRFNINYQTTDVLPSYLQSSGELGWRMSSIGFHIGYQWMNGKKKQITKGA